MENASKALIIAGAILLAILLISLGIMIFSQAQNTVNNSGMSQAEITAYNEKVLKYEGDKVKGSIVKSMINEVNASNKEQEDSNASDAQTITVYEGSGQTTNITENPSKIKTNYTYKVEMTYSSGRITEIHVTQNT